MVSLVAGKTGEKKVYRVSHMVVDLVLVDLAFYCSTACLTLPQLVGICQKLLGSWAKWWNTQIKVNQTQVYDQMGHPVMIPVIDAQVKKCYSLVVKFCGYPISIDR